MAATKNRDCCPTPPKNDEGCELPLAGILARAVDWVDPKADQLPIRFNPDTKVLSLWLQEAGSDKKPSWVNIPL